MNKQLQKKNSPVARYAAVATIRVILKNSSEKEKQTLIKLIQQKSPKTNHWLKKKAIQRQREIFKEITAFMLKAREKAVYG